MDERFFSCTIEHVSCALEHIVCSIAHLLSSVKHAYGQLIHRKLLRNHAIATTSTINKIWGGSSGNLRDKPEGLRPRKAKRR